MSTRFLSDIPGFAPVGAMAAANWAWRDRLLLAARILPAYRLFLLRMDRGASWRELTAALNALAAGATTGPAGIGLVAGVGAGWLGCWHPAAPHPALSLPLLAAAAAWCCLARESCAGAVEELRLWLWMFGGALLAIEAQRGGVALAPCLFVLAVGLAMLWAGWQLASVTGSAFLRPGSARR